MNCSGLARHFRHARGLACLALALTLAGCGSSGQNLTQCGNGRLDPGEQCDDGNTVDTDACTSVCRNARCGDGAVERGVEVCDGNNVGLVTCEELGLARGSSLYPACQGSCAAYDLSVCGAAFTPTPVIPTATSTATPTSTPTASPTPTLPTDSCGNGLLQPGETCASCPADCQPAACVPSGTTSSFALAVTSRRPPTRVAVQLAYRSSVIAIPGSGSDVTVRQRVRFAPPPPTTFTVDDLDYAVDIDSTGPRACRPARARLPPPASTTAAAPAPPPSLTCRAS
ncbi:MAG: hypothetical protein U0802_14970 [Candidatus Binatia bacterium]